MIRRKAKKPGRPRKATHARKFCVSVSARTGEQLERIAAMHGVTLDGAIVIAVLDGVSPIREGAASVEVRAAWCDLVAERAGI